MKHLRRYIRQTLIESFSNPGSVSDRYAIWTDWWDHGEEGYEQNKEYNFVMYDLKEAKQWFDDNSDDPYYVELILDAIINNITIGDQSPIVKAVMRIQIPDDDTCNGAWEVIRSAAIGGLGPTLYDMVMSISPNGLMSDRKEVSSDAQNIWSFYANKRNDVDRRFLDPEGFEVTPFEEDDCKVHGSRPADTIRAATIDVAKEYFNLHYPEIHTSYLDDNDLHADRVGIYGDGRDYYNDLVSWLKTKPHNWLTNSTIQIPEDWNEDKFEDWYNAELYDLTSYYDKEFSTKEPLNLSYNTDYAKPAFENMIDNHSEYLDYVRHPSKMSWEIEDQEVENFIDDLSRGEVATIVRDFFQVHYKRNS
jgi:hypothetical protein